jgi:DNA ligase D-like protein (predicted 3'-phosphoesterase)
VPVRRNKTKRLPAPKALNEYAGKRHFDRTPEPQVSGDDSADWEFVVQKHAARKLHYDLRLELDGVLKSWAITRGPSLTVGEKRLAVRTEDHPIEYLNFEGNIPKGEYGGGSMIIWDRGRWLPESRCLLTAVGLPCRRVAGESQFDPKRTLSKLTSCSSRGLDRRPFQRGAGRLYSRWFVAQPVVHLTT